MIKSDKDNASSAIFGIISLKSGICKPFSWIPYCKAIKSAEKLILNELYDCIKNYKLINTFF